MEHVVGADWCGAIHAICMIETASGGVADRFEVTHDAAGLREMMRRRARLGASSDPAVATERPSGLIVDTLVAAGHPVVPIP